MALDPIKRKKEEKKTQNFKNASFSCRQISLCQVETFKTKILISFFKSSHYSSQTLNPSVRPSPMKIQREGLLDWIFGVIFFFALLPFSSSAQIHDLLPLPHSQSIPLPPHHNNFKSMLKSCLRRGRGRIVGHKERCLLANGLFCSFKAFERIPTSRCNFSSHSSGCLRVTVLTSSCRNSAICG